ncbi:MAG: hypothetical protein KBH99_00350 [Syntrophobacteraceae bacterium]|nr:hypothetical protein [Syntrophobacteraceae bacterium]
MPKERVCRGHGAQSDRNGKVLGPAMCKEGKGVRNFACQNYDICLDRAAKAMWSGFTCRDCAQYYQKEEEPAP